MQSACRCCHSIEGGNQCAGTVYDGLLPCRQQQAHLLLRNLLQGLVLVDDACAQLMAEAHAQGRVWLVPLPGLSELRSIHLRQHCATMAGVP